MPHLSSQVQRVFITAAPIHVCLRIPTPSPRSCVLRSHVPLTCTAPLYRRFLYEHIDEMGSVADATVEQLGFVKGTVITVGGVGGVGRVGGGG